MGGGLTCADVPRDQEEAAGVNFEARRSLGVLS